MDLHRPLVKKRTIPSIFQCEDFAKKDCHFSAFRRISTAACALTRN